MPEGRRRGSETSPSERREFQTSVAPHLDALRRFLYRMLASPDDVDDALQDVLLSAFERRRSFRGEGSFRAWLFAIASRKGIDRLRGRKRWPLHAQEEGERAALQSDALMTSLHAAIDAEPGRYEYRQHLAYCFSCVSRSLEPEQSAALMLADVAGLEARDAARAMGLNQSAYKHRLRAARSQMTEAYESLCALVSKTGACWQCARLGELYPEGKQNPAPGRIAEPDAAPEEKMRARLRVLQDAELGPESDEVHRVLFRFMSELWD